jgi:hypothetical protein
MVTGVMKMLLHMVIASRPPLRPTTARVELDAPRDVLASRFSLFGISMTKGENVFYLG